LKKGKKKRKEREDSQRKIIEGRKLRAGGGRNEGSEEKGPAER